MLGQTFLGNINHLNLSWSTNLWVGKREIACLEWVKNLVGEDESIWLKKMNPVIEGDETIVVRFEVFGSSISAGCFFPNIC